MRISGCDIVPLQMSLLSTMSYTTRIRRFNLQGPGLPSPLNLAASLSLYLLRESSKAYPYCEEQVDERLGWELVLLPGALGTNG
jgi:hypothetical protein